jgi:ubiquinone/menaquinone biosynthesis C-methylase UbiE
MTSFDERARDWDSDPAKVERALAIARAIEENVPLHPAMCALEYGCGTGLVGFALRRRLGDMTLADVSDGMLAVVREKLAASPDSRVRPLKLDLVRDTLPEQRFDLIFTAMTLHHIPDTEASLRAFASLLAPRGYLCVADLDAEDGSFHGAGFDGHNGFDRGALGAKVGRAGMRVERFVTAYEMAKTVEGSMRAYPIFLMTARKG